MTTATSTDAPEDLRKRFPAKYSKEILVELRELLEAEADRLGRPVRVLDQFAGTGLIHSLASPAVETFGVEIEPDLAALHERTEVGDAAALRHESGSFDAWATSCTYGNRMGDLYDGRDGSKRMTYRIALGHDLAPGSSAGMQWGPEYRELHRVAWLEAARVVGDGGLGIVNVKNHVRDDELQPVVEWHLRTLLEQGATLVEARPVKTPGYAFGANHDVRDGAEMILVVRAHPRAQLTLL